MARSLAEGLAYLADRATLVSPPAWWAVATAWYGLIFILSAAPGLDAASTESLLDMIALGDLNGLMRLAAHMGLFAAMALWLYLALHQRRGWPRVRSYGWAVALAGLLAVTDEVHQHFVPARHGRPLDVCYDFLGALVGLALAIAVADWARRSVASGGDRPAHETEPSPAGGS